MSASPCGHTVEIRSLASGTQPTSLYQVTWLLGNSFNIFHIKHSGKTVMFTEMPNTYSVTNPAAFSSMLFSHSTKRGLGPHKKSWMEWSVTMAPLISSARDGPTLPLLIEKAVEKHQIIIGYFNILAFFVSLFRTLGFLLTIKSHTLFFWTVHQSTV